METKKVKLLDAIVKGCKFSEKEEQRKTNMIKRAVEAQRDHLEERQEDLDENVVNILKQLQNAKTSTEVIEVFGNAITALDIFENCKKNKEYFERIINILDTEVAVDVTSENIKS